MLRNKNSGMPFKVYMSKPIDAVSVQCPTYYTCTLEKKCIFDANMHVIVSRKRHKKKILSTVDCPLYLCCSLCVNTNFVNISLSRSKLSENAISYSVMLIYIMFAVSTKLPA